MRRCRGDAPRFPAVVRGAGRSRERTRGICRRSRERIRAAADERGDRRLAGATARGSRPRERAGLRGVQRLAGAAMNRVQGATLLAFVAFATWFAWRQYDRHWLNEPIAAITRPMSFEVAQGASLRAVARALEIEGVIDRPRAWLR